ncbi:MAG: hypothetical protein IJ661_06425 [Lachnospiraceae bacterium]|nr:hypothetical protein [Lachnospiraceae bacterium]
MVDTIQETRLSKWRSARACISAFTLITCMLLTACGKADDIVTDYGNQTENTNQTENADQNGNTDQSGSSDESSTNAGQEATGGQVISAKGKTVREMVGGDTLEFEDSMEINGFPIYMDIKSAVIDIPSLNVYQVHRVSGGKKEENEIVENLFGDTAVKLDEIPSSMTNISTGSPVIGAYYDVIWEFGFDNEDEAHAANDAKMEWIDDDERYIHLYQGKYDGIDFILLYGYSDISKTRTIMFTPVSVGDFISDPEYDSVFLYNAEENKTAEKIFLDNDENRLSYSPDELVSEASSFLRDKLGVNVYSGMISADNANLNIDLGTGFVGKNELVFVNSEKYNNIWEGHTIKMKGGELDLDIGVRDVENEIANTGLLDGYELCFPNKFSGVTLVEGSDEYKLPIGYSNIFITSKGVMSVRLSQRMEVTDIVENIQILDGDKIKESFKAVLLDAVGKMELDGMKQLIFDNMILRYYPVQNPSDEDEYTYIPVWEFSTKWDIKNRGNKRFYVYINAIDGTLVDVVVTE